MYIQLRVVFSGIEVTLESEAEFRQENRGELSSYIVSIIYIYI